MRYSHNKPGQSPRGKIDYTPLKATALDRLATMKPPKTEAQYREYIALRFLFKLLEREEKGLASFQEFCERNDNAPAHTINFSPAESMIVSALIRDKSFRKAVSPAYKYLEPTRRDFMEHAAMGGARAFLLGSIAYAGGRDMAKDGFTFPKATQAGLCGYLSFKNIKAICQYKGEEPNKTLQLFEGIIQDLALGIKPLIQKLDQRRSLQ